MSYSTAKRSTILHLLNVGTKENEQWRLINEGITELTEDFSPDVEDLQYVADDNATKIVKRYAPSISLSAVVVETKDANGKPSNPDPVNKWIVDKINQLPLGADADTQYIRFSLHDIQGSFSKDGINTYIGYKRDAVISVDNIGGAAGDNVGSEITLNGKGDQKTVTVRFKKGIENIEVTDGASKTSVKFVIQDSSSTPLEDASVTFNGYSKLTDSKGEVTFDSAVGTFPYSIGKDKYVGIESNIKVESDKENTVTKTLKTTTI